MRYIIYGAGGIGGVIGAQLFQGGVEVLLVARGGHLQAIQDRGLRYQTPHQTVTLPIAAAGHPREIGFRAGDVVILTVKSQHTQGALDDLRVAAGDEIPIFCCQNGVANERMALRRFQNVHAMMVYLPAMALEPGTVQTHAARMTGVLDAGIYPTGSNDLVAEVTGTLNGVNFSARPNPTVMRFKYGKLIMNLRNALAAVSPPGEGAQAINALMRAEAEACFRAAGIDCASQAEETARRGDLMKSAPVEGQDRGGGSSWQSLVRGTGNIEADFLNGEIVLLGRLHGIPTPANWVLQRQANALAASKGAAQSISLAALRDRIDQASNIRTG
ncbi:MAG: ketopantoate reductase family protein [Proteobacteria bacterium]|nr:ketopantoate reductase family protein [Pseudomonadota bacterium]